MIKPHCKCIEPLRITQKLMSKSRSLKISWHRILSCVERGFEINKSISSLLSLNSIHIGKFFVNRFSSYSDKLSVCGVDESSRMWCVRHSELYFGRNFQRSSTHMRVCIEVGCYYFLTSLYCMDKVTLFAKGCPHVDVY